MRRVTLGGWLLVFLGCPADDAESPAESTSTTEVTTADTTADTTGGSSTAPGGSDSATGDDSSGGSTTGVDPYAASRLVFVEFGGAVLEDGPLPGTYEPYQGDDASKAAIIAEMRNHFAVFDIGIVDSLEGAGSYEEGRTVIVTSLDAGGTSGVAGSCNMSDATEGVVLVFDSPEQAFEPNVIAAIGSSLLGITFGLARTDDPNDLTFNSNEPDRAFLDSCSPLATEFSDCPLRTDACEPEFQNSFQELLARLGPAQQ